MKKIQFISFLLCFCLAAGLLIPGLPAYAAEAEQPNNSGMEINKTTKANDDGTYTITLEAYATGNTIISETTKDIPTDIILVLDQSGSMADPIGTVSFSAYGSNQSTNSQHYARRHNNGSANLWHKLEDGSYVSVSVEVQEEISYTEITNGKNNSNNNGATNYWENRNNLYAKVSDEYVKVTVERTGYTSNSREYTYKLPNGDKIATSTRDSGSPSFSNIDGAKLYLASKDESKTVYTYTYTDAAGQAQTIGSSTGVNNQFGTTLYQRTENSNAGGSRLAALKTAANTFATNVAVKAKGADGAYGGGDDIDHRIAVVKFTNSATNLTNGLVHMNTANGLTRVQNVINNLTAGGDTYPATGLDTANSIFQANPISGTETRKRVIVLFTDGYPAESGTNNINYTLCDQAIASAQTSKGTYGATVYTVGIFSGANPSSDIDTNFEYGNRRDSNKQLVAANRYMHYTSSNFKDAQSLQTGGSKNSNGYYLSASDAGTLNSIFQQISDQIQTGGSSTTLDEQTVIKDIIAPAFTLPEGADASDIVLETYACTGKDGDGNYTWSKNADAMGATAVLGSTQPGQAITTNNQISVTGFDFSENYVGTVTQNGNVSYRGNKLVITLKVTPRPGFLGGNNVFTNTEAGIYENANAEKPVLIFPKPTVDVPIPEIAITTPSEAKNIYLLGTLPSENILEGVYAKIGTVDLDLDKPDQNWDLEPWQNEYVNISVAYKDANDQDIPAEGLQNITEDTRYSVTVAVSPKTEGTVSGEAATKTGTVNINVFTPELTYQDSEVFFGDAVPTDFDTTNRTETKWKHGDTESTSVTMTGTEPTLDISYTPDSTKIADGKIDSKEDIPVAATVKIGNTDVTGNTSFLHTACNPACDWNEAFVPNGRPAFLLHVKTASLTIQKSGATGSNEGFIFNVNGPKNFRVSVEENGSVTITGLPLGTYTVTEETGWSWRYGSSPSVTDDGSVTLTKDNCEATVTVTNTKTNSSLLDGNAYARNNSVPAGTVN